MTSQPSLSAIVAATEHSERPTGLSLDAIGTLEPYWEAVRNMYAPFEAGLRAPTGTVYRHQIPGGQLSNLRQQAIALGLGHRFEEVEHLYAACDEILGRPIKVTPSSKVVGDLALHLVASGVTPEQLATTPQSVDLPDSVVAFLRGELGTPEAGFPEPFRTDALRDRPSPAPAPKLGHHDLLALDGPGARSTLSRLLFPGPAAAQEEMADRHGDLSVLPTRLFWYGLHKDEDDVPVDLGPGVRVLIGLEAIGEPDEEGVRSVVFRLNGQLRPIDVVDRSVSTTSRTAEKADPGRPGHVAAPFRGVVTVQATVGDEVTAGQSIATIEAMKMESHITAPVAGTIDRVVVAPAASVEHGDLIIEIRAAGTPSSPVMDPDDA
jgi:pyruvate carboxylase